MRLKDDNSLVELRKLSDVKNGVNKVLGKVIIPNDLFYLQGFTIDGYDLYWYTGDTNNKTYPCEITQFSFKDGSLKNVSHVILVMGQTANMKMGSESLNPSFYTRTRRQERNRYSQVWLQEPSEKTCQGICLPFERECSQIRY